MCFDGARCIVGPLDECHYTFTHLIASTAMCAVAKAITLKGIWSSDFTCKHCIPSSYYPKPLINRPTGDEVIVVKWAWFVLEIWVATLVMQTDRPPTARNKPSVLS